MKKAQIFQPDRNIHRDDSRRYAEIHHAALPQPTANYSLLTANSSYTFSAKERDAETGLSYFGSRYYSSDLSIWLSVDPMSDKYPSLSPYTYCADNPVKLVDPNGEDIWEINEEGRIINHDKSFTEKDIVYRVDNNGNRIEGEFVAFDYGTIEQQKSIAKEKQGNACRQYRSNTIIYIVDSRMFFEYIVRYVRFSVVNNYKKHCN